MFLQFTPAYGFAFLQIGISPRAVFHKPTGRKNRCGKRTQTVVFHTGFTPAGAAGNYPFRLANKGSRLRGQTPEPPQALTRQLPQGDALWQCRKLYRHHQKPSPWGRWLDAKRQDGRGIPGQATSRFSCKLSRRARGSLSEGAGKAVRL